MAVALTLDWGRSTDSHGPWQEVRYKGRTTYRVDHDSVGVLLHAEANGTNSALFHAVGDGIYVSRLTWRWRVLRHPAGADPTKKSLDDRAAAVFVLIHRSWLPWRSQGLIYQWAPKGEPDRWTSSPYASQIRVLTLERAPEGPGWRSESRDVRADLIAAFGKVPDHIEAIGVMCDADNTGSTAVAEFGEIVCETALGGHH